MMPRRIQAMTRPARQFMNDIAASPVYTDPESPTRLEEPAAMGDPRSRLLPRVLPIALPLLVLASLIAQSSLLCFTPSRAVVGAAETEKVEPDRSPVDLLLTRDGKWLLTVNQTSGTVSLIETESGKIRAEVLTGQRPSALALTPDESRVLVTNTFSGEVSVFALKEGKLAALGEVAVGFEPRGVAVAPDGKKAYVALTSAHQIAVIDLAGLKVAGKIDVGKWPRYLALSPDGKRLAVGANGDGGVSVVDTAAGKMLFQEEFAGINLGQMQASADGKYVYFPWMVYRHNPITPNNIRIGWVLASRIARVRLDQKARREAISLDPQGQAIADPHGLALSPDEKTLICTASGTHELLVYRMAGLPFIDYGGPGDHIDAALLKDKDRFYRIELGGR